MVFWYLTLICISNYFLRINSYQWICTFLGLYCPLEKLFSFALSPLWNESDYVWYTLDNSMGFLLLILVKLVDKIVVWWSFFIYFWVNCLYFYFVFFSLDISLNFSTWSNLTSCNNNLSFWGRSCELCAAKVHGSFCSLLRMWSLPSEH